MVSVPTTIAITFLARRSHINFDPTDMEHDAGRQAAQGPERIAGTRAQVLRPIRYCRTGLTGGGNPERRRSGGDLVPSCDPIRVMVPRLPDAAALLPYISRIDASRIYSNNGPLSREFAAGLAAMAGADGVSLTCNGTAAIELALRARGLAGRRTCLIPSFTFIASAHAACNAGLVPYLLDVDEDSLMLTPTIAEAALADLTEPPAAVLVVSAFGAPPDFAAWEVFEERHGIPVVFDAAAALTGLTQVGRQPVCVSLHATKVLGVGEGGAILCADRSLIEHTTAMTSFGFFGTERVSMIPGGNYRMSEYAAAVGLAALKALPERIAALRALTRKYHQRLSDKATRLQHGAGETWVTMTLNAIVPPETETATLARLTEARSEWRHWWGPGCHQHPAFADLPHADLPVTDALAPRVIGLPFHDDLTDGEINRVVACLP